MVRLRFLLFVLGWLLADGLISDALSDSDRQSRVVELHFEGLNTLKPAFIRTLMEPVVDRKSAQRALKQLHDSDYFLSVDVNTVPQDRGLKVTYFLKEAPLIDWVRFEGNHEYDRQTIVTWMNQAKGDKSYFFSRIKTSDVPRDSWEAPPLSEEDDDSGYDNEEQRLWNVYLSDRRKRELMEAVTDFYHSKGYAQATVTSSLQALPHGRTELVVRVFESGLHEYAAVEFVGNHSFKRRVIERQARMTLQDPYVFNQKYQEIQLHFDRNSIIEFYQSEGFLDVEVDVQVRTVPQEGWFHSRVYESTIVFTIEEGPRYQIADIEFRGNRLVSEEDIMKDLEIKAGDFVRDETLDLVTEQIGTLYGAKGYYVSRSGRDEMLTFVSVEKFFIPQERSVKLTFVVHEGRKISSNRIRVKGNLKSQDKIIRRELVFSPGSDYDLPAWRESERRLNNTGYFKQVPGAQISLDEDASTAERDIVVEIDEEDTGSFSFGFTVSGSGGLSGNFDVGQSNFDITDVGSPVDFYRNRAWVGAGQAFALNLSPGTQTNRFAFSFYEPWLFEKEIGLGLSAQHSRSSFRLYDSRQNEGSISLEKRWRTSWTDHYALGWEYRFVDVTISNVDLGSPSVVRDSEGRTAIRSTGPFFRYDSRDNQNFPTQGQLYSSSAQFAGGVFGGLDYMRFNSLWRHHWLVGENYDGDPKVLTLEAEMIRVEPYGDTEDLPIFERLFAGGEATLRGYSFGEIGPREGDEPIGGEALLRARAEYEFPLQGRFIRWAWFIDAAEVKETRFRVNIFDDFRYTAGGSLRVLVPGLKLPVKINMGFPFGQKDTTENREVFSFSLSGAQSF